LLSFFGGSCYDSKLMLAFKFFNKRATNEASAA